MKNLIFSIILLPFFVLAGCASVPTEPTSTSFSFDFEDSTYQIIGIMNEEGERMNFLLHRQNDSTLFRVIDLNQDGIMNRVVTGTIDLDRANVIYNEGIRQAIEKGQFKETAQLREFDTIYDDYRLQVQSNIISRDQFQNRFIIYDLDWIILGVYFDEDSDGTLTILELGEINMEDAQNLYEVVLHRASEKNRIDASHSGRYIISYENPVKAYVQ